jgi:fructose-1,6-bisphosphatase/inositol monophosphatase family enzyme
MSVKEVFVRVRERIQAARRGGVLRPLDENDREALNVLSETIQEAREDGSFSNEEIDAIVDGLQAWRKARRDTP